MGFTVKCYGSHIFTVKCYKARIINVNYTLWILNKTSKINK